MGRKNKIKLENFNRKNLLTKVNLKNLILELKEDNQNPYILGIKFNESYREYLDNTYGDLEFTAAEVDLYDAVNPGKHLVPNKILLAIEEIQSVPGMEYTNQIFSANDDLFNYLNEVDKLDIISVNNYNKVRRAKTIIDRHFGKELDTHIIKVPEDVIQKIKEEAEKRRWDKLTESKYQAGIIFTKKFFNELNTPSEMVEAIDNFTNILKENGVKLELSKPNKTNLFEMQLCDLVTNKMERTKLTKELNKLNELEDLIETIIMEVE